MRRYGIFHTPLLSFYSKDFYREVGLFWRGTGLGYLFLLVVVVLIPLGVKMHVGMNNFVAEDLPVMVDQVPDFWIVDGKVSIDEDEPYYLSDPETGEVFVIIDTTGEITSLDETDAYVLVTESSLEYRQGEFETRKFDLSKIKKFEIDEETIVRWAEAARKFLAPFIYVFMLVFSFVSRAVQVLIYAAMGMVFVSILKTELEYLALMRLAVAAVTPCIVVRTVLSLAGVGMPCGTVFLFLFMGLGYLYFGVKACAEYEAGDNQQEEILVDGPGDDIEMRGHF